MLKVRETGILKVYDPVKGYGFITREEGKDVYLHFTDLENQNDAAAILGSVIEFVVEDKVGSKGPRAKKATIIG